jgi:hypothetical protein
MADWVCCIPKVEIIIGQAIFISTLEVPQPLVRILSPFSSASVLSQLEWVKLVMSLKSQ